MPERRPSTLFRVVRWFVWLFSPKFRTSGEEHLPPEPCVIVGTHSQMFGPIAGEIFLARKPEIWCTSEMMERAEVADYAYRDFWSSRPKSVRWFFRLLSHAIVPLAMLIFHNARTIPVYRDARLISTFRTSIEALQSGRSILIFPECYDRHNNIVYEFQDKFVDLARFYYKKTGVALRFVPLYLAPKLSMAVYGEGVTFRPDAPIAQERRRICNALMDRITDIAVHLPEHRVVPYPNVPARMYPKNIPLEVYNNETQTG